MSFTNAQLKTELTTDPAGLGYAAQITAGAHQNLADVLNFRRDGVSACPVNGVVGAVVSIFRNDIRPNEVMNNIASADFPTLTQLQVSKLQNFLTAGTIDATLANVRANFVNIFSGMTATTAAMNAMAQRNGSRVESLYGTGVTVSATDVARALSS